MVKKCMTDFNHFSTGLGWKSCYVYNPKASFLFPHHSQIPNVKSEWKEQLLNKTVHIINTFTYVLCNERYFDKWLTPL